jgi:hypothetical protein
MTYGDDEIVHDDDRIEQAYAVVSEATINAPVPMGDRFITLWPRRPAKNRRMVVHGVYDTKEEADEALRKWNRKHGAGS